MSAFKGLLLSAVLMCRGVLPGMRERVWGRMVINTSFTVKEMAPRLILSKVFRTGVIALAKTLPYEVAGDGFTVNCVCSGAFGTTRLQSIFKEQAHAAERTPEEVQAEWEERIPIGRILQPKELADLVDFFGLRPLWRHHRRQLPHRRGHATRPILRACRIIPEAKASKKSPTTREGCSTRSRSTR